MPKKRKKKSNLEEQYKKIFGYLQFQKKYFPSSLKQNPPKPVKTYVTYGAYEEPY